MRLFFFLWVALLQCGAREYWASPTVKLGAGTQLNPWGLEQAFRQRYWPGDIVWVNEGRLTVTNRLRWTASGPGPGAVMSVAAWQRGRVIIDAPGIDIGTMADVACATFQGLSFTDSSLPSTESPIGTGARQRQFFDGGNEFTRKLMGFRECFWWDTGQALGNVCAHVEGCMFFAVGRSDYQHVIYNGDPIVPQKRIRWNLSAWNSGDVFKLPTAQNYLVSSNVVLAPGGLTLPYGCQWAIIEEGQPCAYNTYQGNLVVQELSGPFHQVPVHLGRGGMLNTGLRVEGNTFVGPRTPLKISNYSNSVVASQNVVVRQPGLSPSVELSRTQLAPTWGREYRVGDSLTSWARLDVFARDAANLVVCNWSASSLAAVDGRALEMEQGRRFVMIPATAPNGRWRTNEFDGRRIIVELQPAAWPMQVPSYHPNLVPITNMLPRFGAWRIIVAPGKPQSLLATELGSVTLVQWNAIAGAYHSVEVQYDEGDGWKPLAIVPEFQHEIVDDHVGRIYRARAFNGYCDSGWSAPTFRIVDDVWGVNRNISILRNSFK